jgi:hypothetical protein
MQKEGSNILLWGKGRTGQGEQALKGDMIATEHDGKKHKI